MAMSCSQSVGRRSDVGATRDIGSRLSHDRTAAESIDSLTLLNDARVALLLGIHKRSLWRLVSTNDFPQPIRFGGRITRWRLSEVREFIESKGEETARREVRR